MAIRDAGGDDGRRYGGENKRRIREAGLWGKQKIRGLVGTVSYEDGIIYKLQ